MLRAAILCKVPIEHHVESGSVVWSYMNRSTHFDGHGANSPSDTRKCDGMTVGASLVMVVQDGIPACKAVELVLQTAGLSTECFTSAAGYLARPQFDGVCCMVLDAILQGQDGLTLQTNLTASARPIPIVFLSHRGDIAMAVMAMKSGAVDFLTNTSSDHDLVTAVRLALASSANARNIRLHHSDVQRRFDSLTPREYQVVRQVIRGRLNKQIAAELAIAERTVKVHRANAIEKLAVDSTAELVALVCDVHPTGQAILPENSAALVDKYDAPRRPIARRSEANPSAARQLLRRAEDFGRELAFMP